MPRDDRGIEMRPWTEEEIREDHGRNQAGTQKRRRGCGPPGGWPRQPPAPVCEGESREREQCAAQRRDMNDRYAVIGRYEKIPPTLPGEPCEHGHNASQKVEARRACR